MSRTLVLTFTHGALFSRRTGDVVTWLGKTTITRVVYNFHDAKLDGEATVLLGDPTLFAPMAFDTMELLRGEFYDGHSTLGSKRIEKLSVPVIYVTEIEASCPPWAARALPVRVQITFGCTDYVRSDANERIELTMPDTSQLDRWAASG